MPKVKMTKEQTRWQFVCTCPAAQYHKSDPYKTLVRAASVNVKVVTINSDGTIEFTASSSSPPGWDQPSMFDDHAPPRYDVVFYPNGQFGNICKHGVACMMHMAGPQMVRAIQAVAVKDRIPTETAKVKTVTI